MRLKLIVFCLWFFGERENQNQIVKSRPRPRYSYRIQPFNRAEPITRVRAAIVTPLEFLLCSLLTLSALSLCHSRQRQQRWDTTLFRDTPYFPHQCLLNRTQTPLKTLPTSSKMFTFRLRVQTHSPTHPQPRTYSPVLTTLPSFIPWRV